MQADKVLSNQILLCIAADFLGCRVGEDDTPLGVEPVDTLAHRIENLLLVDLQGAVALLELFFKALDRQMGFDPGNHFPDLKGFGNVVHTAEIGRASCRERVNSWGVAVS